MNNLTAPKQNLIPDIPKRGMPVTIVTGFLGSGKTTLLNHILHNCQDLKVAVLVNEFGDINIDSQLLISVDQNMIELTNGCICCTINDGLLDAVYRVLERSDRIDYLIVETTGIADPLPIALTFISTDLRDLTRLDSILTLVDVETFTPEHFESDAALNQISYGDIILLNKTDLVPEAQVKELEDYIRAMKVGARVLRTSYGQVPLPLILDVGVSQAESYPAKEESSHDHHHHHYHDHHHAHSHHLENDGFMSFSFESDRPLLLEKFQEFLTEQLPEDVFRAKGLLWFKESSLRHIFQLCGKRVEMKTDKWISQKSNQLVFIGRNLNEAQIQQQLKDCLE
ncbi:GTP-binding protein [Coleofasciculus sp. FACHB-64]|uniref:CobW family GTP-binding protein n=1 Tax=Cyanophyceae TaxID=3028117 RepID=UPI001685751A|nr:GTP-binding protein [Coleofasciculus sp. FACHB-64]MBD2045442.1 GTP-binding protein [Coleofasciculus sp. FACHB-64]